MRSIKVRGEKPGKVSRPRGALGGYSVLGKVDIYRVDHEVGMWVWSPKGKGVGSVTGLGLNPAVTGLGIRPLSVVWGEAVAGSQVRNGGPAWVRVLAQVCEQVCEYTWDSDLHLSVHLSALRSVEEPV